MGSGSVSPSGSQAASQRSVTDGGKVALLLLDSSPLAARPEERPLFSTH